MWLWPILLSLAFAAGVGLWMQHTQNLEREDERRSLITDALTLQNHIQERLASEQATLDALVAQSNIERQLTTDPRLAAHLGQLWISVTALDERNRLLAHAGSKGLFANALTADRFSRSMHLVTGYQHGVRLIARVDPAALLRSTVPWWLARRYDIRLMDGDGQGIASLVESRSPKNAQTYRIGLDTPLADTYLELATRETLRSWWRSVPMVLMAMFVALSALAAKSLRSHMAQAAQAQQRWKAEAAWRRAIEESLTVGLRARDLKGRVVHVNRAFADLVGYPVEALIGQAPPMPYWLPEQLQDSMRRHERNLAGQAPREGYETQFRRADGQLIDVMMFETPWIDEQGGQLGWMGSFVDITASKAAQGRERRQLDALAQQARLSMLGEVASALAHQLNQPLAAIASYQSGIAHVLERSGSVPAGVLEALAVSREQVDVAAQVVQHIRGFLTRRAPQRDRIALSVVIERALYLMRHDLRQRAITVRWVPPQKEALVLADQVLIEQVLINLIRNAEDALRLAPKPKIEIVLACHGHSCAVSVTDNGSGLGGKDIDTLANPFFTSKPDGMGMGLSICRSIVEAHHGHMLAQDVPDGGACLTFVLPVADAGADLS